MKLSSSNYYENRSRVIFSLCIKYTPDIIVALAAAMRKKKGTTRKVKAVEIKLPDILGNSGDKLKCMPF